MARSRTRSAIIFIVFLVLGFGLIVAALAALTGDDGESQSLGDLIFGKPKIAVVPIKGAIDSADETLKQLRKYGKNPAIKAIILRIDSPGGSVAPAQELYRQIRKLKKDKPVVASIQTVGASAAYYIASAADRVVCSEGTITGSIGVIMILPNLDEITEKIGLKVNVIKAGKFKDIGSMVRPMTEDEREYLKRFAKGVHSQFINDVAKAREGKIDRKELEEVADGRFFTGKRAKELGLVDSMGNFYDAVEIASELARLEKEPALVYPEKKWGGYLDLLLSSVAESIGKHAAKLRTGNITPNIR
jgi:protease-4